MEDLGRPAGDRGRRRLGARRCLVLLRAHRHAAGRTVTVKIKYADFQIVTRSRTLTEPVVEPRDPGADQHRARAHDLPAGEERAAAGRVAVEHDAARRAAPPPPQLTLGALTDDRQARISSSRWRASSISAGPPSSAASPSRPSRPASSSSRTRWACCWCSAPRASSASPRKASACSTGRARIVGDTPRDAPGNAHAEAGADRPSQDRRDPDRARHGLGADHALSRQASRREVHHPVAHLDRGAVDARESRGRCRPHLHRQRAARPRARRAALSRAVPPADLGRQPARRPRQGDLGRGRAASRSAC